MTISINRPRLLINGYTYFTSLKLAYPEKQYFSRYAIKWPVLLHYENIDETFTFP